MPRLCPTACITFSFRFSFNFRFPDFSEFSYERNKNPRGNYIYTFLDRVFYIKIIDLFTSYINIYREGTTKYKTTLCPYYIVFCHTLLFSVSVNFCALSSRGPRSYRLLECAHRFYSFIRTFERQRARLISEGRLFFVFILLLALRP